MPVQTPEATIAATPMTFRAFHAADSGRAPPPGAVRDCLVVDDDPVSRVSLAQQLAGQGVQVRVTGAAEQALDIWQDWRPSAVLIDCVLPDWDGYRLAGAIRDLERKHADRAATLLIAVSGRSDQVHWRRCEVAGMDGVVAKPARVNDYARWLGLAPDATRKDGLSAPAVLVNPVADKNEAELRCLYASSCESDLQAISVAMAAHQAERVRQHAHRIEGASRVLGATAVANAAQILGEAMRAARDPTELAARAATLERAYRQWQRHHVQNMLHWLPGDRLP